MTRLQEHYRKKVIPVLREQFGYGNVMAVPRLEKVVLNVGLSASQKDSKFQESAISTLTRITGQKPAPTVAKKSISNFKIRQGMTVGIRVTLRGRRMFDFVDKLIHVTLPRVRDFRGLSPSTIDQRGNLSIGFRESISFPEVSSDEVERLHGLEVAVVTTAKSRDEGLALLKALGFPFREK
ncbi:50S ribosomal protein L5 [Candidatus Uhrbacteria bacterium RIFCSPHIGHO2_12_FULL_57_11]|uniref:Large ribosomal subunit protein uL5 n=2 Tax=Candidatus Uhriibacteriota TaxID=1752732 RepID=A0A1F7UJS4_9BACT|nr:MAG: 50S ribosomal protein L5 [Candidatus Uhrbacteria bacterium RIFCSPHIGHO2_02_FULL_57_19]OGL78541.1 MAG: 50S ribosomal protein L5 [Candidatus Uhrbacteria bacterium RIFCSPHIGHO2_12_FULL_57_11]